MFTQTNTLEMLGDANATSLDDSAVFAQIPAPRLDDSDQGVGTVPLPLNESLPDMQLPSLDSSLYAPPMGPEDVP